MSSAVVFRFLLISFGSLSLLTDGKRLLPVAPPSIKVSNCRYKIKAPGQYVFQHRQRPFYVSTCEAFIQAPPRHLIRIAFAQTTVACDTPRLQLLDGYLLHLPSSGARELIPPALGSDPGRIVHICSSGNKSEALQKQTFLSSQNYAQLLYSLHADESFTVAVEFQKLDDDKDSCEHIFEADGEFDVEVGNRGRPGACPIYVSGGVAIEVLRPDFATEQQSQQCEDADSALVIKGSSKSWHTKSAIVMQKCNVKQCRKHYIAPCSHSTIQLNSRCFSDERVTLHLRPLQDDEREPWNYYCY